MTKPFPCCNCECVYCPQYGGYNNWGVDFSGLTGAVATWLSSTSGNPLYTDLNALSSFTFVPTALTGTGTKTSITSNIPLFPGQTWTTDFGVLSGVVLNVTISDNCGKVWLSTCTVGASLNGGGAGSLITFNGATQPGSINCGTNLVKTMNSTDGIFMSLTGSITLDPP